MAGTDSYCNGCTVWGGQQYTGPNHSLTSSKGTNWSTGVGCGGAVSYGSYFCGDPAGCHSYGGWNVIVPGIRHPYSSGKPMSGYSTWGSTGPQANCTYSSVYSVGGPVTDRAKNPEGIPVLDRVATTAPDALAELFPGADVGEARQFSTPKGNGWVVVDPGARLVCLAIDDEGTGYGYSCQRFGEVRSAGAIVSLEDADESTGKGDVVIALAPEGVDEVQIDRTDGGRRVVPVRDGVAVTTLSSKDEVVTLPAAEDAPAGVKARRMRARR